MPDTTPPIPAIKVAMMPRDTNVHGTIFGGVILSQIDQAGAIAARNYAPRVVTVCMREVEFKQPVYVGDIVSFYADVTRLGTTSITVKVRVESERLKSPGERVVVTEAEVVYVATDEAGRKTPVSTPIKRAH